MFKYYCPKCHDTCDHILVQIITKQEHVIDVGSYDKPNGDTQEIEYGYVKCVHCGQTLKHSAGRYLITTTELDGEIYLKGEHVYNIERSEMI